MARKRPCRGCKHDEHDGVCRHLVHPLSGETRLCGCTRQRADTAPWPTTKDVAADRIATALERIADTLAPAKSPPPPEPPTPMQQDVQHALDHLNPVACSRCHTTFDHITRSMGVAESWDALRAFMGRRPREDAQVVTPLDEPLTVSALRTQLGYFGAEQEVVFQNEEMREPRYVTIATLIDGRVVLS